MVIRCEPFEAVISNEDLVTEAVLLWNYEKSYIDWLIIQMKRLVIAWGKNKNPPLITTFMCSEFCEICPNYIKCISNLIMIRNTNPSLDFSKMQ